MGFEERVSDFVPEAFDNRVTDCEVRNEVAVHDVEVEVVGTVVEEALGLQEELR